MRKLHHTILAIVASSYVSGQKFITSSVLANPRQNQSFFSQSFVYSEVASFHPVVSDTTRFLYNDFGSSIITNPQDWFYDKDEFAVTELKIVFTKYPPSVMTWKVNYYSLLADRLKALFEIDSTLNDAGIVFKLVLQTGASNLAEAQNMVHGFEVSLSPKQQIFNEDSLSHLNLDSLTKIERINRARKFFKKTKSTDTTVLNILRNYSQIDSLLIVIDCTGSMAPFYTQVSLWAATYFNPSHYYVLFTDAGPRDLPIGETGGFFKGFMNSSDELIKLFEKCRRIKGKNREPEENDMEAILIGINDFPNNNGVILIADNYSCIRDYQLIKEVDKPIMIIPCGGSVLNPLYLNLAWFTDGVIFYDDQYLFQWSNYSNGEYFALNDNRFQYKFNSRKGRFEVYLTDKKQKHPFCSEINFKLKKVQ